MLSHVWWWVHGEELICGTGTELEFANSDFLLLFKTENYSCRATPNMWPSPVKQLITWSVAYILKDEHEQPNIFWLIHVSSGKMWYNMARIFSAIFTKFPISRGMIVYAVLWPSSDLCRQLASNRIQPDKK